MCKNWRCIPCCQHTHRRYKWWQVYLCPSPLAPGALAFSTSALDKTDKHCARSCLTWARKPNYFTHFPLPCIVTYLIYTVFRTPEFYRWLRKFVGLRTIPEEVSVSNLLWGNALSLYKCQENTFKFHQDAHTIPYLKTSFTIFYMGCYLLGFDATSFVIDTNVTKEFAVHSSRILN